MLILIVSMLVVVVFGAIILAATEAAAQQEQINQIHKDLDKISSCLASGGHNVNSVPR